MRSACEMIMDPGLSAFIAPSMIQVTQELVKIFPSKMHCYFENAFSANWSKCNASSLRILLSGFLSGGEVANCAMPRLTRQELEWSYFLLCHMPTLLKKSICGLCWLHWKCQGALLGVYLLGLFITKQVIPLFTETSNLDCSYFKFCVVY